MGDSTMNKDYPDNAQRYAVCQSSAKGSQLQQVEDTYYEQTFGSTESIIDYIPSDSEYLDFDEQPEVYIIGEDEKPGLWENIRKKKKREGKNYKPAKPGDKDRPDPTSWKKAQSDEDNSMQVNQINKMHQQLMMLVKLLESVPVEFEEWAKDKISKAEHYIEAIFDSVFYASKTDEYSEEEDEDEVEEPSEMEGPETEAMPTLYAAENKGKKVQLNKPFRTPKGPKKFSVYVKNDKGNVVKVNFGDPNMSIKRDDPESRKRFRARHQCDTSPGPKWKARYWSCKFWSKTDVSDLA